MVLLFEHADAVCVCGDSSRLCMRSTHYPNILETLRYRAQELYSGAAPRHRTAILQIIAPLAHQSNERVVVSRQYRSAKALYRFCKRFERFGAVVVQALDFVIQVRAFLRHACGYVELRVERGAGH